MGSRGPTNAAELRQLADAAASLDAGRTALARTLAADALKTAVARADAGAQAQALAMLAFHDHECGRFRRAAQAAQRASQLFQGQGDLAGEARTLSLLAQAHAASGRDAEALEAAVLAVRLGDLLPPGALQVQLSCGLAQACLGARAFDDAESALRDAQARAAERRAEEGGESLALLPAIGLAWAEVVRLHQQRYFTGVMPPVRTLVQRIAACRPLLDASPTFDGLPAFGRHAQRLARCATALAACWDGDTPTVRRLLAGWRAAADGAGHAVDQVLQLWVCTELEWANRNLHAARRSATEMIELAGRSEFEQMAYVGHALRGQVLRAMGRFDLALDEERQHRGREWRVQTDRVDIRRRAVQAQLDVRSSLDHLRVLAQRSQELERLSFEDALTGIANRRHFESRIGALLGGAAVGNDPHCLALIDLDDFKAVNDTHSHETGDEVLRAVAQAIRAAVREDDLPARLGGDEFVVLFPHTPLETARQVCDRIQAQIAALRWDLRAPELRVGASIGVAQAQPGDGAADLVRRSDAAMFRAKGRART